MVSSISFRSQALWWTLWSALCRYEKKAAVAYGFQRSTGIRSNEKKSILLKSSSLNCSINHISHIPNRSYKLKKKHFFLASSFYRFIWVRQSHILVVNFYNWPPFFVVKVKYLTWSNDLISVRCKAIKQYSIS